MLTPNHVRLLCTKEAARLLGTSPSTLRRWRSQDWRPGPPFIRLGGEKGRTIRYEEGILRSWIARNTVDQSANRGA